jgi:hypothetical protein
VYLFVELLLVPLHLLPVIERGEFFVVEGALKIAIDVLADVVSDKSPVVVSLELRV